MGSHETASLPADGVIYMNMLDALVAGEGFEAVAELCARQVGRRVTVVVPHLGVEATGGEQIDEPERLHAWSKMVTTEMPIASRRRRLGSVVMRGESDSFRDQLLRAAASASLTAIAVADARREAELAFGGSLLEELLSPSELRAEDVLKRAARAGCDLDDGLVALCVDPRGEDPEGLARMVKANCPAALVQALGGRVYALMPSDAPRASAIADRVSARAPVAISSTYADPGDAAMALEEAELMLALHSEDDQLDVRGSNGDMFRLLFRVLASHPDEMKRFRESTIGPLLRHDEQYKTDLVPTLRAYLHEHNCNMNLTAKAIYAHRHTVSNRLARVQELTGLDPFDSEDRERLGLAIKAHRVVERHQSL